MKKIFWPVAAAIFLTFTVSNISYWFGSTRAEATMITFIAATLVALVVIVFIRIGQFIPILAFAALVVGAWSAGLFITATPFLAFAFPIIMVTISIIVAAAQEKELSVPRILMIFSVEEAAIGVVLYEVSVYWHSFVAGVAGIGLVWLICFLPCPRFLLRHKQEEPRPAA